MSAQPVEPDGQEQTPAAAAADDWSIGDVTRLHDLGWHLYPSNRDKKPDGQWRYGEQDYVEHRASAEQVARWIKQRPRPIGWVILQGGPKQGNVLDIEAAGMLDQTDKGAKIREVVGRYPATCQRPSPSGGLHLWFVVIDGPAPTGRGGKLVVSMPPGATQQSDGVLLAEVRGHGQYAVMLGHGRGPLSADWAPHPITLAELEALYSELRAVSDVASLHAATATTGTGGTGSSPRPVRTTAAAADSTSVYWTTGEPCWVVRECRDKWLAALSPDNPHDPALLGLMALTRLGEQGHQGVKAAVDALHVEFDALAADAAAVRKRSVDSNEWARMVVDIDAKIEGDPTAEADRGCCPPGTEEAVAALKAGAEKAEKSSTASGTAAGAAGEVGAGAEAAGAAAAAAVWKFTSGDTFVLDASPLPEPIWGRGAEVLWSKGEPALITGAIGAGKTTLLGWLTRGLLGLESEVLGYPVVEAPAVLYLACDRPRQIGRNLRRMFTEAERARLRDRLVVWEGPPPKDLGKHPEALLAMIIAAGMPPGTVVIIDSLKDVAVKISDDEVGSTLNRALQTAVRAGYQVIANHHQRKATGGAKAVKPKALADVFGSVWVTAGMGTVLCLWAERAGDAFVELSTLKPAADPVGPLTLLHDLTQGTLTPQGVTNPADVLRACRGTAMSLGEVLSAMGQPDERNARERARRLCDGLVDLGKVRPGTRPTPRGSGKPEAVYTWVEPL